MSSYDFIDPDKPSSTSTETESPLQAPTHGPPFEEPKENQMLELEDLQKTDRSGKLVHYNHIEAIRTKSGLIISDSSCYARGRARCSTPRSCDIEATFDVTTLKANLRGEPETIYEITDVDDEEVIFESDRKMNLDGYNWIEDPQTKEVGVLGV